MNFGISALMATVNTVQIYALTRDRKAVNIMRKVMAMTEYIDRKELLENLNKFAPEHYSSLVDTLIKKQPAADVVEVKHGEWEENRYAFCNVCPECGTIVDRSAIKWQSGELNFCPNCGVKMDGKEKK